MTDQPAARRHLWTVLLLLLAAAFALWVAALLPAEGREQPALLPLAVLSLAAGAGVLATGGWARRVIGGLIVVCVAGPVGLLAWSQPRPVTAVLAACAGALLLAAGVLVVARGHRMPRMGTRYRSGTRPTERTAWDELDAGGDPTA